METEESKVFSVCIIEIFALCIGGNFNIHIRGGSAISSAHEN